MVEFLHNRLSAIRNYSGRYFLDCAIHDMDYDKSDIDNPRPLKPHAHIVVESRYFYRDGHTAPFKFRTWRNDMYELMGLVLRSNKDGGIINNIKRIDLKSNDLESLIAYQDHDTYDGHSKGKYQYLPLEINPYRYSNDIEYSRSLIDDYHRYDDYKRSKKTREIIMSKAEWEMQLYHDAKEVGLSGKSLKSWYNSLDLLFQTGRYDKVINKGYQEGATEFISNSSASIDNTRCCIFIEGGPDIGKSHNSVKALQQLVGNVLDIRGGKTGKFDNLTSDHQAIVVSDTGLCDYHGMLDDAFCFAYRRNNSNPLWCGKYLVITYNGDPSAYMRAFAKDVWDKMTPENKEALLSRLYHCECDESGLHLLKRCSRGNNMDARDKLFLEFFDTFNYHQQFYIKNKKTPIIGEYSKRVDALLPSSSSLNVFARP